MQPNVHLVTGATGLIGSHLVRRLSGEGVPVRVLIRREAAAGRFPQANVEPVLGDLRDLAAVQRAMSGVSHVFHCGALVSDWGPRRLFQQTNVQGTRHVVQAALAEGVQRLVHLSSAAVYGYPRQPQPVAESQPQHSRGIAYIATKIAAERVVAEAHREQGLPATMLRPVMVFGPGCQNYVGEVARHLRRGSLVLLDGGRHVAGLAYVDNVVDAIVLAARSAAAVGRAINVWDDSAVSWRQYFDALADGIGAPRARWSVPTHLAYAAAWPSEAAGRLARLHRRPWLTRLAVLELGQSQRYDISLARNVMGYTPRVGFEEAMHLTCGWAGEQR